MIAFARRRQVAGATPARRSLRAFPALLLAAVLVAGCGAPGEAVAPASVTRDTTCSLDGMVLTDYPGPKAQIHYESGAPDFFCDTVEMMQMLLRPEQKKRIVAVFTQDMAKTDWAHPEGHWIDARSAFYVVGSKRNGSMGPTLATFAAEGDASAFAREYGGNVLRFDDITLAMVATQEGADDLRM